MKTLIAEKIKKGLIYKNMLLSELVDLLGVEEDSGGISRKYKMPCVFKYEDLEFGFSAAKFKNQSQFLIYVMNKNHEFLVK